MRNGPAQVILLIDALGWELAERTGFLADRLPARQRLRTILGYSSAAIPSLLSGALPREHGHWFLYFRAARGSDSPFVGASLLARLPRRIRDRWEVRRRMGEWWRRKAGIAGYFSLYEVPYADLARLDYVERLDTWGAGTFPCGSFLDDLAGAQVPFHVSDWRVPDDAKLAAAIDAVRSEPAPRVVFLYLTEIDALQHAHGSQSPVVEARLAAYRGPVEELLAILGRRGPVRLTVCSDHGMTDVHAVADPGPWLQKTGLREGRDYQLFLDSTFARFWPAGAAAAEAIRRASERLEWGDLLTPADLQREGVDFPDGRYGRILVLARPGWLICPSFMGRSPIRGMHGYSPDDPASDAVLLGESAGAPPCSSILDLRGLFRRHAGLDGEAA